ncbi:MAG: aspartate kinase [Myxococcales bacterium 68-20]|nr:aspartate kinase [Myxococcales bacterium]OJY25317.1 MAG: aspartate kinase [Myxococcales bacterium 68-20]
MALVVQKFGGTSVGSVERIRNVAKRALATQREGNDVVVIVSAMSGETNRLLKLAHEVVAVPEAREMDVIASTGEQVTSALLSLAIQSEGGQARSLLGHQVKILTDGAFTKARIKTIEGSKIFSTLKKGQIAVVAGFQGVDENGDITTLGRGGSDTTAVAVAAAIGADACEIYTDVDGVYTTDPNVCPSAKKISKISYEEMLELASLGAKVLQIRSVEIAMKYGVPIHVRSSFNDSSGTWVTGEDKSLEDVVVAGVAYDKSEARVDVVGIYDKPGIVAELFTSLAEKNVSVDMIIQNATTGCTDRADVTFTLATTDLVRAKPFIDEVGKRLGAQEIRYDEDVVKVSIVGLGMREHAGIAARMFRILATEGINIQAISTSEIKVSCLVHQKYTELAVRALHDGFGLSQKPAT